MKDTINSQYLCIRFSSLLSIAVLRKSKTQRSNINSYDMNGLDPDWLVDARYHKRFLKKEQKSNSTTPKATSRLSNSQGICPTLTYN